jgi:hypothetical protein
MTRLHYKDQLADAVYSVYSENHTKPINGKNVELLTVKVDTVEARGILRASVCTEGISLLYMCFHFL